RTIKPRKMPKRSSPGDLTRFSLESSTKRVKNNMTSEAKKMAKHTPVRIKKPQILEQIAHDNHAIIEASAGTGKTYTIEHLVVDLLVNNPDLRIHQILVVTYTERATFELSARIRSLLQ